MVIFTPDKRYTDMEQSFDLSPELAKQARYDAFLPRLAALIEGIDDEVAVLANTAAALREAFGFFWVGFYRAADGELRLGPFQGTVACYRIRKGRAEKRRFIRCGGRGMAPLRHTVLRYCDVFRHLGFVFDDPAPVVRTAHPNPFGEKHGVWVGFAPFSAHRGKTCPEPQRREVVRLLAARCERLFIHSGGGDEAAFAEEMERTYPNVTALWGKVRFAGEIDLIANLDCVVTMDSLVMHLAALVGTPCVSLWGATHPGLGFLGYGAPEEGVLQADLPCRPCSVFGARPCRLGDYRCLAALTPERVVERVERLIARPKP